MMKLLVTFFLLLPIRSHADVVSLEHFFSNEKNKGGVACAAVAKQGDGGLVEATLTYQMPDKNQSTKSLKKLRTSCAQGGGDCQCVVLYSDAVKADGAESFFHVKADDGADVWVLASDTSAVAIDQLATETRDGEIHFRNPAPRIYRDKLGKNEISAKQLVEIPKSLVKRKRIKFTQENIVMTWLGTTTIHGVQMSKLSVDLLTSDDISALENIIKDEADNKTSPKPQPRYHLRSVWMPTFDSEGRINFWLSALPGC